MSSVNELRWSGKALSYGFVILCLALGLVAPLLVGSYYISFLAITLMYIALSLSWNFFSGYTGYWSFGHNAFFGIGAYCTAVAIVKLGVPRYPSLILAGLAAGDTATSGVT